MPEELIRLLADDEWAQRIAAEQKIIDLGLAALPAVRAAQASASDPEVSARLLAIAEKLERLDTSRPTLVSLRATNAPPQQVVAELSRKSGVEIRGWADWTWRQTGKSVTVEFDREPFWKALLAICSQGNLQPQFGNDEALALHYGGERNWTAMPQAQHGCFLFLIQQINRNHSIDFGSTNQERSVAMSMQMHIFVDPKIRLVGMTTQPRITTAIDENGMSLLPPRSNENPDMEPIRRRQMMQQRFGGRAWMWQISPQLVAQTGIGRRITSFEGVVDAMVVDSTERWEIEVPQTPPPEGWQRQLGDARLTVRPPVERGDGYSVSYEVEVKTNDNRWGAYTQTLMLVDAAGVELRQNGGSSSGSQSKLTGSVQFQADRGVALKLPLKIVWEVPLAIRDIEVPFAFKDVPLP